jgi:hypothetical protein
MKKVLKLNAAFAVFEGKSSIIYELTEGNFR